MAGSEFVLQRRSAAEGKEVQRRGAAEGKEGVRGGMEERSLEGLGTKSGFVIDVQREELADGRIRVRRYGHFFFPLS